MKRVSADSCACTREIPVDGGQCESIILGRKQLGRSKWRLKGL